MVLSTANRGILDIGVHHENVAEALSPRVRTIKVRKVFDSTPLAHSSNASALSAFCKEGASNCGHLAPELIENILQELNSDTENLQRYLEERMNKGLSFLQIDKANDYLVRQAKTFAASMVALDPVKKYALLTDDHLPNHWRLIRRIWRRFALEHQLLSSNKKPDPRNRIIAWAKTQRITDLRNQDYPVIPRAKLSRAGIFIRRSAKYGTLLLVPSTLLNADPKGFELDLKRMAEEGHLVIQETDNLTSQHRIRYSSNQHRRNRTPAKDRLYAVIITERLSEFVQ